MVKWMTVRQVAKYLQVSEATIYNMARAKDIPATKLGSQWRFDQSEVDAWLHARDSLTQGTEDDQ
jgi:excisionase family DNA binding protein